MSGRHLQSMERVVKSPGLGSDDVKNAVFKTPMAVIGGAFRSILEAKITLFVVFECSRIFVSKQVAHAENALS